MVHVGDGKGMARDGDEMKPRAGEKGRRCANDGSRRCLPWSRNADGVCLKGRNWRPGRRSVCLNEHARPRVCIERE